MKIFLSFIVFFIIITLNAYSSEYLSKENKIMENLNKRKSMIILIEPDFSEGNTELKNKNVYLVRYIKELKSQ